MIILQLLAFIFILGLIIVIHEMGHFILAKKSDILCHEFSIGMGPLLAKKQKGETMYALRAIPIGGYVAMAGEQLVNLVKKGDLIGLGLKDSKVDKIYIEDFSNAEIVGKVVDFDLYKEKETDYLYITIDIDGTCNTYYVLENACYIFKKGEPLQLPIYERSYESKSLLKRFLTVFMGPCMNFVLAFFLFLIVGLFQGQPNYNSTKISSVANNITYNEQSEIKIMDNSNILFENDIIVAMKDKNNNWVNFKDDWKKFQTFMDENCGLVNIDTKILRNNEEILVNLNTMLIFNNIGIASSTNNELVEIGEVFGRSETSGAKPGMVIKAVKIGNGDLINIYSWSNMVDLFKDLKASKVKLVLDDNGKEFSYEIESFDKVIDMQNAEKVNMKIGVSPTYKFNLGYAFTQSFKSMWTNIKEVYQTLGLLIFGTEGVGVKDLSGPIGIFSATGQYMAGGLLSLISFAGFLSVNIGFVNLLPIPALDGGRLAFLAYETITKKKVNRKVENSLINVTYIVLMILFVYVCFNDILRLF